MLLKILGYIPFLQCLTHFPLKAHKTAAKKFFALLILTSLPIIFAAVLSPIPAGDSDVLEKLTAKLREAISVSELFVYTASFLTPILYLIFEKYSEAGEGQLGVRLTQGFKGVFKGYGLVALLALLTIFFTASAFSSLKINPDNFKLSFLNHYLFVYSVPIYLFSIYCWYLTLLDGVAAPGDFVGANRSAEDAAASAFSARLKKRGEDQ